MRTSRRVILGSLAASFTLALGACGFSPMYGAGGAGAALSDIRVETGEERVDFLLQEALIDQMGARHASGELTLRTQTELRSTGLGVGADAIVRRFAIRLDVDYAVFREGEADPVLTGSTYGEASYDLSDSVYASMVSEQDAQARAARMAADRVAVQLVRALDETRTPGPGTP